MTTVTILESLQAFLLEKVCSKIKLQKPDDDDIMNYTLIHPTAFIIEIPQKGFLPKNIESEVPCVVIGFEEAFDDGQSAEIPIRLVFCVYSPGFHYPNGSEVEFKPILDGWKDLLNFIDLTNQEIQRNQLLNKITLKYPIKWGYYQQEQTDDHPYLYGWMTFSVKKQSYPKAEIEKLLL